MHFWGRGHPARRRFSMDFFYTLDQGGRDPYVLQMLMTHPFPHFSKSCVFYRLQIYGHVIVYLPLKMGNDSDMVLE